VALTQFHWTPSEIEPMRIDKLAFYVNVADRTLTKWQKSKG